MELDLHLKDKAMGDLVPFTIGLSPVKELSIKEYRRLANILLMQYDKTEFKVKAVGRLGLSVSVEVAFPPNLKTIVVRL